MTAARTCGTCGRELAAHRNAKTRYCDARCRVVAWRARHPDEHLAWHHGHRKQQREERQRTAPARYCLHCRAELPRDAMVTRRYCTKRCARAANRLANREKVNAAQRAKRAANPHAHRASNLAWNKRNPEKIRAARERFEARKRAAAPSGT